MLSKQLYRIYCAVYSGGRGGGGYEISYSTVTHNSEIPEQQH